MLDPLDRRLQFGGLSALTSTGTSVVLEGELTPTPEGVKQAVELKAAKIVHVGPCDGSSYPMAKQRLPIEFLREKIHLRPRHVVLVLLFVSFKQWCRFMTFFPERIRCIFHPYNNRSLLFFFHIYRTNLIGAVARIRNALAFATHTFFQSKVRRQANIPSFDSTIVTTNISPSSFSRNPFFSQTLLSPAEQTICN